MNLKNITADKLVALYKNRDLTVTEVITNVYDEIERTDPPVSEPRAINDVPEATLAAEPPLEPPGTRSRLCGFRVTKNPEFSVDDPIANSSQFVFPMTMAPAPRKRSTAVAVYGGA